MVREGERGGWEGVGERSEEGTLQPFATEERFRSVYIGQTYTPTHENTWKLYARHAHTCTMHTTHAHTYT
jgi:hypothetical protein